jgi:hypothetical protein
MRTIKITQNYKWWTAELRADKKRLNNLYKTMKKTQSEDDHQNYLELRTAYRSKLFKTKRNAWKQFTSEARAPYLQACLNRTLAPKPTFQLGHIRRKDGVLTRNVQESLQELLLEHFPNSVLTTTHTTERFHTKVATSPNFGWITRDRMEQAIKHLKNSKKPGPDNMSPEIIKQLPDSTIMNLMAQFNASIALSYIPPLWKKAMVVFLP